MRLKRYTGCSPNHFGGLWNCFNTMHFSWILKPLCVSLSHHDRFNITVVRSAVDYYFIIHPRKLPSAVLRWAESTQTGEQGQTVSHCTHVHVGQFYRFVITKICWVSWTHTHTAVLECSIWTRALKLGGLGNRNYPIFCITSVQGMDGCVTTVAHLEEKNRSQLAARQ